MYQWKEWLQLAHVPNLFAWYMQPMVKQPLFFLNCQLKIATTLIKVCTALHSFWSLILHGTHLSTYKCVRHINVKQSHVTPWVVWLFIVCITTHDALLSSVIVTSSAVDRDCRGTSTFCPVVKPMYSNWVALSANLYVATTITIVTSPQASWVGIQHHSIQRK